MKSYEELNLDEQKFISIFFIPKGNIPKTIGELFFGMNVLINLLSHT